MQLNDRGALEEGQCLALVPGDDDFSWRRHAGPIVGHNDNRTAATEAARARVVTIAYGIVSRAVRHANSSLNPVGC